MAETRTLAPLLELAHAAEGGRSLSATRPTPRRRRRQPLRSALRTTRRAPSSSTTAANATWPSGLRLQLRRGDSEPYLAHAAATTPAVGDDPVAAKQRLLEDWWQTARGDLLGTVMFARSAPMSATSTTRLPR